MWEHKKPDLRRLQLFGCDAYVKVLGPLKKLDEYSKKYTFVGYAPVGCRLWNSSKRKIHIARDVKFGNLAKKEEEAQEIYTKNLNLPNKLEENKDEEDNNEEQILKGNEEEEQHENGTEDDLEDSIYEDIQNENQERTELEEKEEQRLRRSQRIKKFPAKYNV